MTLPSVSAAAVLRDRLDHWARMRPEATAMTFGDQSFTWEQWRQRILRLTGALRDAGVRAGDRLAVLDLNHLATVELTLAGSALGAATLPVNFRLSPDQIRYILEDSRPVMLFLGAQFADVAAAASADALVLDRLKDMIISGGENVYGPEVESVLSDCPGVSEGVIIGVPHERWGESVKAFVVLTPGAELSAEGIIDFCRARLAHYQCPTSVEIVEELPRSATGKVLKRTLRAPYWAGRERVI